LPHMALALNKKSIKRNVLPEAASNRI